jgi:hypothetical protein
VFIIVLGLLLSSSNPAKEEEREFLTQTLSIVKVFSFCKVFSDPKVFSFRKFLTGQYRRIQLERVDNEESYWLLLFSFYSLVKNTLIYCYHPVCGMAQPLRGVYFHAGFVVRYFKPSKGGEREFLHYHGKTVLTFCRTP